MTSIHPHRNGSSNTAGVNVTICTWKTLAASSISAYIFFPSS
jgi:hypothetical protein